MARDLDLFKEKFLENNNLLQHDAIFIEMGIGFFLSSFFAFHMLIAS